MSPPPTWSLEQLDALNRLTTVAQLLSTTVHEAGNALQIVSGNAELIEARPDDGPRAAERAHRIKVHADLVGSRLQALAALGQAVAGGPRRLDLRRLAERAVDLRRYSLNRASIAVAVEGAAEAPFAGDEAQVVRLIANLILNAESALRGRPDAAIRVTVSREAARVAVAVADNGPGVPPDRRAAIFEPMAAGRAPGCGLAVARWLAERHAGAIVLDETTAGARFVLTLPAALD